MNKTGIMSPWMIYYQEMKALFDQDEEINIQYDEDNGKTIKLYVNNAEKAEALDQLLPKEKKFGNVTLKIQVVPANKLSDPKVSLFRAAFKGNPAVTDIIEIDVGGIWSYVVFQNKVVQYHSDTLADPHGLCSTLYQELARDVFGEQVGIFFCTEKGE